jgi:hypothetical protein
MMGTIIANMNALDLFGNYISQLDPITKRTTITSLNPNFALVCSTSNVLTRYIGFLDTNYLGNFNYQGSYPFNMQYTNFIYVISSLFTGDMSYSQYPLDKQMSPKHPVLCTVPISNEPFDENVVYRGQYPIPFRTAIGEVSRLTFELVDDNGNKMDLNGNKWMINLTLFVD